MESELLRYKLLLIGDQGVGKTSIAKRHTHDIFPFNYKPTIGVDFTIRTIRLEDGTSIRMQLWDIAGQERFGNMTRIYYKEAVGALVVYDVTKETTFDNAARWKADVDSKVMFPGTDRPIPCVLLANKIDMCPDGVDPARLDSLCKEQGFIKWFATSALDGTNIVAAFDFLVGHVYDLLQQQGRSAPPEEADDENVVDLGAEVAPKRNCPC